MKTQSLNFENTRVLIIGDVMLDQYWFGDTSRISPEAPVPVVLVDHIDERPGGAANVALGVKALGANPTLLGLTGNDATALRLEQLLKTAAINFHFDQLDAFNTITKLRVLSRNQHMLRLDTEKPFPKPSDYLKTHYLELLDNHHVVILSDYGKGTLSDPIWFIEQARAKQIPVIVDPKSIDFSIYRGATVIKPNLKEFEAVVGCCKNEDIMVEKAIRFLKEMHIEALADLKKQGHLLSYGMSTKTLEGGMLAVDQSDLVMVFYNQAHPHERPVIEYAAKKQKGVLIKKALMSGHLSSFESADPIQDSFRFIFQAPGVSSIVIGTLNPTHLIQNHHALSASF